MLSTDLLEHQLLDALPATIHTLDLDGHLRSVHQAATRFGDEGSTTSPHAHESLGKPIWESAGHFSRDQVEHAMRHLRAGRAPIVRWEITRPDDRRVLLAQMTPLHDDSHAVTGYVVSTTDISASARARDASTEAAITLSRATDLDRIYQDTALELRKVLRPDLIVIAVIDETSSARVVYDSGSDSDRRALEQRFATAWQSAIHDGQIVTVRADATVEITAPLMGVGGILGAITIASDDVESPARLTESERYIGSLATQTAAAIERSRHAARAAHRQRIAAIGEVAAGVAHELRNPIFGISSAAQLLRFRAREDPVMEKNAGRILREVERLNRMVATLLELGRPIALKLSNGDPDTVWDDVLESERGRLESRVVAVRRTRPSTPVSIPIDGEQLAQAFRSVLSNAVDAAPEASDITLQSVMLPTGGWRCRLTNRGEPISPEMLPRVFEPFLSTKPGGTGVGLALARRIIDEHHGAIAIESNAEAGTTLTVSLPGATRTVSLP
jgi:signal transduction histidine kinase